MKLKTRFYLGTVAVFVVLALVVAVITVIHVNVSVIELSANRVRLDINSARQIVDSRRNRILDRARFLAKVAESLERFPDESKFAAQRLEFLRKQLEGDKTDKGYELDILSVVDPAGRLVIRTGGNSAEGEIVEDPLIAKAVQSREPVSGIILLPETRLRAEGEHLAKKCLENGGELLGMFMGAAVPLVSGGEFWGVLEAGIILNGATDKVDAIRDLVFEKRIYKGKPVGTATLFMNDLRISTNALDGRGQRAIGTRAAPEIAEHVLKKGLSWTGSAPVVDTTYLAQYDPIRDPDGNVIGMLYVGELKELYEDMRTRAVLSYLLAILGGMVLSFVVFVPIARSIVHPIRKLSYATQRLAAGDLTHRVGIASNDELGSLSQAFDHMAAELEAQRSELEAKQRAIEAANEDLRTLNKNYMELLGFVSHELKNPLSSAVMGLYCVKDGYLGAINEAQAKALDSVGKSLDYFKDMIRHYLDLSRLEKGEIRVKKATVPLLRDVVTPVVDGLQRGLEARRMILQSHVPEGMTVEADRDLLRIVVDNLLSNAIKYGREGGKVRIEAVHEVDRTVLSVYNEGPGVAPEKVPLLFRKFSRVYHPELVGQKGTGLGLYICKEIIDKHGGRISVTSEEGKWIQFSVTLPERQA